MRILVVGAGSTGGYFGGRLAQAGRDVTFLVRPNRAARLRARGLEIVSPLGDVTLHPGIVTADQITGPYDLVLVSVKAFALEAALVDVAPAIGPKTMILPVLNGMKHMDLLADRFGADRLLGGVCKIMGRIDDEGRIVQMSPLQELTYGETGGTRSARIEALDAVMQGAGFDAQLSDHILLDMWEKWVFLASLGATTCLLRGSIGDVAAAGGKAVALAIVAECAAIAEASGYGPRPALLSWTQAQLTSDGSPMTSSLYRDLSQGNAVEADQIIGDLAARARALGIPTPLLEAVGVALKLYENRRAQG
ncbi:2-dehydropantoate 2-reductase [Roseixanthobacter glucoisosaccharinicivorans]|uniref:2-dehydropantoate 2-reductase n=1 Tax=Roseixanthobacter glucoisosaccharinicivorans TaxID=3119923 RepID=UPI003729B15D